MCKELTEIFLCCRQLKEMRQYTSELEAQFEKLKKETELPPLPEIKVFSMTGQEAEAELGALGLKLMYPVLLDASGRYYYSDDEGWAEVFYYIYTVFPMPPYIAFRMDCEDFAILLKGLVSALFGLNYFALTIGNIPQGCHAFNFFRTEDRHLILEPQLAQFFEWGERKYTPKYALQ